MDNLLTWITSPMQTEYSRSHDKYLLFGRIQIFFLSYACGIKLLEDSAGLRGSLGLCLKDQFTTSCRFSQNMLATHNNCPNSDSLSTSGIIIIIILIDLVAGAEIYRRQQCVVRFTQDLKSLKTANSHLNSITQRP